MNGSALAEDDLALRNRAAVRMGGLTLLSRLTGFARVIVVAALLPSFLVYPYVTFLPVFARDILGSDQTGYGYLASAVGLGS